MYKAPPKSRRTKRWNAYKRALYAKNKMLSSEEKWKHDQFMLWHKLHSLFTRKEYITYEDLPGVLQNQINPFKEFIYP